MRSLLDVLVQVETHMEWPVQTQAVLISLLGKPLGGDRPIALTGMLYRVWTRARNLDEKNWDAQLAGKWDHATANHSALRAGLGRAFCDELCVLRSEEAASFF